MANLNTGHGYGQVELNKVAFRRDGRIEAQCRLDDGIEYIENGMILAIDPVNHVVKKPTGDSEEFLALNYSAEHMYDAKDRGLKHFRVEKDGFYPRLGYLTTGDIFTTNAVTCEDIEALAAGQYGHADASGYIKVNTTAANAIVKVIEITTMPDGAPAVKFIAL